MKLPTIRHFAKAPSEGHKNRHVLGNEGVWGFLFGVFAFILVQFFLKLETPNSSSIVVQANQYLFTWPLICGLSAGLVLFIVAYVFCTRNDKGLLELSDKHRWVRPFGFVVGGVLFCCFGWLFAFGIVLWMSTLHT